MKKSKAIFFILPILAFLFYASTVFSVEITVNMIPSGEKEFLKLRNKLAVTPEGGAAVFMVSMLVFPENQPLGLKFFTIALARENLSKGKVYKGFKPGSGSMYHINRLADPKRKRTPYAYISGTAPENGYQADLPHVFEITTNKYSVQNQKTIKVFVDCSGAATPRPMTMRKNDKGLWKTLEFSSMSLDVVMPDDTKDEL